MGNSAITEILLDFITLVYPRYCLGCENALVKGENIVCTQCIFDMPRTNYHLNNDNHFYKKLEGRVSVEHVIALFSFVKQSKVQHLLHNLKYKNHPEIGVALGQLYGTELMQTGFKAKFDLIVPVPLHASRKRMRGFNQSFEFGKGLSEILDIPCIEILERIRKTNSQTQKTKLNRWENVSDVFNINNAFEIEGKKILLIDDVITTGATLEACAKVLLDNQCKRVSIACIAAAQ